MRQYVHRKAGDRQIPMEQYNKAQRGIRRNETVVYDPRFFAVSDTGGARAVTLHLPPFRAPFWAKITDWNAGTTDYTWNTLERNAGHTAWQNDTDALSSTGSATGTKTEAKAREQSGFTDLPDDLPVIMQAVVDADGDLQYTFHVPVHRDATTIVHRTTLAGSGTYGNREDLTYTEAQLKQASQLKAAAKVRVGGQAAGKAGWIITEPFRGFVWDGTNKKYYAGYVDNEYDPLGRGPLSSSEEFYVEIIDLTQCA